MLDPPMVGHGVFIRREYKDIFLESIKYCQQHKGLEVCAYCIMSSHIPMILGRNSEPNLEGIIRDIKNIDVTINNTIEE